MMSITSAVLLGAALFQMQNVPIQDSKKDAQSEKSKADMKQLQGTWRFVSFSFRGKVDKNVKGRKVLIDGNTMVVPKYRRSKAMKLSFQIDSDKAPKQIDFDQPGVGCGIFKLEDNRLWLCVGQFPRPKKFISQENLKQVLYVFEKVPKKGPQLDKER